MNGCCITAMMIDNAVVHCGFQMVAAGGCRLTEKLKVQSLNPLRAILFSLITN